MLRQKRVAFLEAQYESLVPGTADSFLKLWCTIGKSNSVQAQELDRTSQRNFSTRVLNEMGCSYFKVTCNAASNASFLVPRDSSGVNLVVQEWETFLELDLPETCCFGSQGQLWCDSFLFWGTARDYR